MGWCRIFFARNETLPLGHVQTAFESVYAPCLTLKYRSTKQAMYGIISVARGEQIITKLPAALNKRCRAKMFRVTGLVLLPLIALAACGCAGSEQVANGAFELGAFHVEGQYEVEQVGSLCSRCVHAWKTSGVVMGWVADGYSDEVVPNAAVSVDSLSLHTISDSTGRFVLAVPPGRHRITLRYVGSHQMDIDVELAPREVVEVRARLGTDGLACGVATYERRGWITRLFGGGRSRSE